MNQLSFPTEIDRQKGLAVIDDLIQRTESGTSRALYRQQRERIVLALVEDHQKAELPPLGPFPAV